MTRYKNSGFTLIELVIVIIMLGILSATALPKLLNLGDDAHEATARSTFAAFDSAVKLYHSCWLASGETGYVKDLACFGDGNVDSTITGFPLGVTTRNEGKTLEGDYCRQIWFDLLNHNDFVLAPHTDASFNNNTDVVYWYYGKDLTTPNSQTHCYYNYIGDDHSKGSENWQLRYYPADGHTVIKRATLS